MLFENYKLEDMFFTNHSEEYTEEETKEILSTFPEAKYDGEKVEAVEQLIADIDNGTLKMRSGCIHTSAAKAYAKKHPTFSYRSEGYYNYAGLYVMFNSNPFTIRSRYHAEDLLKRLKNDKKRLDNVISIYTKKEKAAKEQRELEQYKTTHADRIAQGLRTYEIMRALNLDVAVGLDNSSRYYSPIMKHLHGYDFIEHNCHGEIITAHDELLTEQAGKELEQTLNELGKELSEIIDIYKGKFTEIIRKGKEN